MIHDLQASLAIIQQKKPLILCLTNYVTMDFIANSLLALGAAPLMSESIDELEELVTISQAVYLNIGTLNALFNERILFAAQLANQLNKPVILDPVGAGASKFRTDTAMNLLPLCQVIRGNASEVLSLYGVYGATKGVETSHSVDTAKNSAKLLAQKTKSTLVISGKTDFVTDGIQEQNLPFGSDLMPRITGMGCAMTAVLSAFVACDSNHFKAAAQATAYFGLCGEQAFQHAKAPGSFKQAFIDSLYQPDWQQFSICSPY